MEKNTQGIVAAFALLALLVGFALGAVLMGEDTVTVQEKVVEKIVNVSVDTVVEVEAPSELDRAVAEFLIAVEDEEDEAGNDVDVLRNYNFDEVEVSKVYDEYVISYDGDETTVEFSIRLILDDDDDREKNSYNVIVEFEEDEDTEVTAVIVE